MVRADKQVRAVVGEVDADARPSWRSQWASVAAGHFCLGASLARLEARVALDEFVRRVSSVACDPAEAVRFYSANVRGFAHLPVTVTLR